MDSEDEGDVVVVAERPAPASSVQAAQTAQAADLRREAAAINSRGADGGADAADELNAAVALSLSGSGAPQAG